MYEILLPFKNYFINEDTVSEDEITCLCSRNEDVAELGCKFRPF